MSSHLSFQADKGQPWVASEPASVFHSPSWLVHWRRHYGQPADQFIARDGGLLPMLVRRQRLKRVLPVRTLRFVGTGDAVHEELCPEFCDLPAVLSTLEAADCWQQLCDLPWDLCRFDNCLPGSAASTLACSAKGFRQPCGVRYCLDLPATLDHWLAGLSGGFRSKILRTRQRIAREGMQLHIAVDPGERVAALPALVALHQARWQARGGAGVFRAPRFLAFHRDVLADPAIPARLAILYRDGRAVAAWYGFDFNGTRVFYQSGIDAGQASFSPGIAMHLCMIEDAIASGMSHYDFMKGDAGSWKARFGCRQTPVFHYLAPAPHVYGRLLRSAMVRAGSWQPLEAGA